MGTNCSSRTSCWLNRMEELIDHWHNAQLMHPGRDKMQQNLEWRFKFPPG